MVWIKKVGLVSFIHFVIMRQRKDMVNRYSYLSLFFTNVIAKLFFKA